MANDKGHLVNIEKVEYNYHNHIDTSEILSQLNILKLQNQKIMASNQELEALVNELKAGQAELQTSVDAEQAAIEALLATNAEVVTGLNQQIADLQAELAAGASGAQIQAHIDSLTELKDSIATTKADIEGTVQ